MDTVFNFYHSPLPLSRERGGGVYPVFQAVIAKARQRLKQSPNAPTENKFWVKSLPILC